VTVVTSTKFRPDAMKTATVACIELASDASRSVLEGSSVDALQKAED
jgi:hypothetical protein